jgi:hypothetical protein
MRRYVCGTPVGSCSGGSSMVSARLGNGQRTHASPQEAFKCYYRYLVSVGYEPIGHRELRAPDGSGILVLTKKSHFGGELRSGKGGEKSGKSRFMPMGRRPGLIF